MIRVTGKCENKSLQLDQPVDLPDGTEVVIEIRPVDEASDEGWRDLGLSRLEAEWDNPEDAIYDNWRELYGV
jgi:predicted DNA-binding antitoxin AbrB/MazE fold protein